MQGTISTTPALSSLAQKLVRLLSPLTHTQSGDVLYRHVEGLLSSIEANHRDVEDVYAGLLCQLLDGFAQHLPPGSPLEIHTRLLRLRLAPPLSPAELAALRTQIETYNQQLALDPHAGTGLIEAALAPLLSNFGIKPGTPAPEYAKPDSVAISEQAAESNTAPRVDSAHGHQLDQNRQGIQRVQDLLATQVHECTGQNETFGAMLLEHLDILRNVSTREDTESLRRTLIEEIHQLLEGNRKIASQLESAQNCLQIIETDSQRINDELTRAHLLSLTDELTGLPNRRAFLRHLEDEVSRVQRYGNPLTLALIDLDGFKDINDRYGHAVGDEVLKVYARAVLSVFRHHDMVARYGGEEFAVILPNTHSDGAMRALHKIQKRAAESTYHQDNKTHRLPTFSAGVALYKPGEALDHFIERADQGMYRAKKMGRNRIESDQQPSNVVNLE